MHVLSFPQAARQQDLATVKLTLDMSDVWPNEI